MGCASIRVRSPGRCARVVLGVLLLGGSGIAPAAVAQNGVPQTGAPRTDASQPDTTRPFYEHRLVEGTLALQQGRPEDAAVSLRIAAFGFLDDPPKLAEALTRLALAQAQAEDAAGFRETFRRLDEIEKRFGAYRQAELSPEERAAFELRVASLVPAPQLRGSSAFRRLAEDEAEDATQRASRDTPPSAGDATPKKRRGRSRKRAAEEIAASDAGTPDTRSADEESPDATAPPGTEAEKAPEAADPLTAQELSQVEQAKGILAQARQARELDRAFDLLRPVAEAHPDHVDLQRLLGEIAYRASRWEEAARFLERGGDPLPDRPELLFYLAVSLYESGRRDEAKEPLERALPRLERNAFVEGYVTKILRQPAGSDPQNPGEGT